MNPLPIASPEPQPLMNAAPGEYDRRHHGHPLVHQVIRWARALEARDQVDAAAIANRMLEIAKHQGASELVVREMFEVMQNVVQTTPPPGTSLGGSPPETKGSADGIDWYGTEEGMLPYPDFYVLDKRSGIELKGVLDDLQHTHRYLRRGARAPNRVLFIGGAGSGKTTGALYLGKQLHRSVALIRIDGVVSSLAGTTSKNLRACFEAAADHRALLCIDEFEAIAVRRNDSGPNTPQWSKEVTSALLQLLDSIPKDQIVIGATNVPEAIDGSALRRLRKHVYFHPPDRDARAAMLGFWWKTAPHKPGAKRVLLDLTEGLSGDFLERVAEEANRAAARRDEQAQITIQDVRTAMTSVLDTDRLEANKTAPLPLHDTTSSNPTPLHPVPLPQEDDDDV